MSALGGVLGILADQRVDALEVTTAAVRAIQAEDVRSGLDHLGNHLLQRRDSQKTWDLHVVSSQGHPSKRNH